MAGDNIVLPVRERQISQLLKQNKNKLKIQHQTAPAEFSMSSKLICMFVVQICAEFYVYNEKC